MKRLIIILLLFPPFFKAQNQVYFESNWGISINDSYYEVFPGTSFLIGKKKDIKQGFVDMQIGLAIPAILTAKIGLGKYFNIEKKSHISFGVRPWPLHGYTQLGFDTKKGKSIMFTFEGGTGDNISFISYGLVTVGFRWNMIKNTDNPKSVIYDVVEIAPEFKGGHEKLNEYLVNQIKYPEEAKQKGIQGKVFVKFIVMSDGSINGVRLIKGVHETIDNEALRVVKAMPNWVPGKHRGKTVNCSFAMPIVFKL